MKDLLSLLLLLLSPLTGLADSCGEKAGRLVKPLKEPVGILLDLHRLLPRACAEEICRSTAEGSCEKAMAIDETYRTNSVAVSLGEYYGGSQSDTLDFTRERLETAIAGFKELGLSLQGALDFLEKSEGAISNEDGKQAVKFARRAMARAKAFNEERIREFEAKKGEIGQSAAGLSSISQEPEGTSGPGVEKARRSLDNLFENPGRDTALEAIEETRSLCRSADGALASRINGSCTELLKDDYSCSLSRSCFMKALDLVVDVNATTGMLVSGSSRMQEFRRRAEAAKARIAGSLPGENVSGSAFPPRANGYSVAAQIAGPAGMDPDPFESHLDPRPTGAEGQANPFVESLGTPRSLAGWGGNGLRAAGAKAESNAPGQWSPDVAGEEENLFDLVHRTHLRALARGRLK